jgi:hypothetical protein
MPADQAKTIALSRSALGKAAMSAIPSPPPALVWYGHCPVASGAVLTALEGNEIST